LLNPVKHPAARLDNGTGSNPVSSHPVGYGVRLSVLFRLIHRSEEDTRVCLPAFTYQPLAQLVSFPYSLDFDFKVSLLVGAGGDSAFNGRVFVQSPDAGLSLG
jgi:hypothetical protein